MTALTSTSTMQSWSADVYERNARFVGELAGDVVALLDPRPGERILDIGCGDGVLTQSIAARGAEVVGFDFSQALVARARERGVDARHGNAEELPFEDEFDGVFSNAAMHWMIKAYDTAAGAYRALRRRGRFVGEFAGAGNARIIRRELHKALATRGVDPSSVDPWYLPNEHEYRALLQQAGFGVHSVMLFERPVVIPYPLARWIRTFGSPYIRAVPNAEVDGLLSEVMAGAAEELMGDDGKWTIDYTRIRFKAVKGAEAGDAP